MASSRHQAVAKGGMWNTQQVSYSKETQNLLKDMMKESKLTNFQQRQLSSAMKGGQSLPTTCNPTSSAKPRAPPSCKKMAPKVINAVGHSAQSRTREVIEASGAYERDQFVPGPPSFYEKDKKRLANIMAYGEDIEPPDKTKFVRPPPPPEPYVDRFDELLSEIDERRHFLEDMEAVGKAEKYRSIIETEISQKIREMELIDQKRSKQLEQRIQAEEAKKKAEREKNNPIADSDD